MDDADDNEQRTSAASDDCEHSLFSKHSCTPNAGSCSVGVSKTTVLDADTAAHDHDYGDDDDDEDDDVGDDAHDDDDDDDDDASSDAPPEQFPQKCSPRKLAPLS